MINLTPQEIYELQVKFYKGDVFRAYRSLAPKIRGKVKKPTTAFSRKKYYAAVWKLSNENAKYVKGVEKRKWLEYDLEHIVPVSYGFKNQIDIGLIASLDNLRMMEHDANMLKRDRLTEDSIALLKKWGIM